VQVVHLRNALWLTGGVTVLSPPPRMSMVGKMWANVLTVPSRSKPVRHQRLIWVRGSLFHSCFGDENLAYAQDSGIRPKSGNSLILRKLMLVLRGRASKQHLCRREE
jgi:hypothetical protein